MQKEGRGATLADSGRVALLMAFAMTVGRVDFFIEDAEEMTTSVVKIRNSKVWMVKNTLHM